MSNFNIEDIVVIYKETPTFEDGTIAQIIDRDPHDDSYSVVELKDIDKAKGDTLELYKMSKWVSPKNMAKISLDKPKKDRTLIYAGLGLISIPFIYELWKVYNG